MATQTLSFTITGEFVTTTVRDMWSSRLPYSAIELLKSMIGMPKKEYMPIILGKRRLVDDSNVGINIEDDDFEDEMLISMEEMGACLEKKIQDAHLDVFLKVGMEWRKLEMYAEDGWKNSDYDWDTKGYVYHIQERIADYLKQLSTVYAWLGKPLSSVPFYNVTAIDPMALYNASEDEMETWRAEVEAVPEEETVSYFEDPDTTVGVLDQLARTSLTGFTPEEYPEGTSPEQIVNAMNQKWMKNKEFANLVPDLDDYIEQHATFNKNGVTPESIEDTIYRSGWIKPNGNFYGCPDTGHSDIAHEILKRPDDSQDSQKDLEADGWIKLSMQRIETGGIVPTPRQADTIGDCYNRWGAMLSIDGRRMSYPNFLAITDELTGRI